MGEDPVLEPAWTVESQLADKLGESPVWVPGEAALYWVDFFGPTIRRKVLSTGELTSWTLPGVAQVGSIVRLKSGLLAATDQGLFRFEPHSGRMTFVADPNQKRVGIGYNDAKVDRHGRYWVGTYDTQETAPRGILYALSPYLHAHVADSGYTVCNGPAFSLQGDTLYFSDTLGRRIVAYHLCEGTGQLTERRDFYVVPANEGYPDGITVDAEGCLWIAHYGGSCLTRVAASGERLARYRVPAANVTSLCFGGTDFGTVFVTTGEDASAGDANPFAGRLLSFKPGVKCPEEKPFEILFGLQAT